MYHEARIHIKVLWLILSFEVSSILGEKGMKYLVSILCLADYYICSHNRDDFAYLSKTCLYLHY